jgi:hypothetical protein
VSDDSLCLRWLLRGLLSAADFLFSLVACCQFGVDTCLLLRGVLSVGVEIRLLLRGVPSVTLDIRFFLTGVETSGKLCGKVDSC